MPWSCWTPSCARSTNPPTSPDPAGGRLTPGSPGRASHQARPPRRTGTTSTATPVARAGRKPWHRLRPPLHRAPPPSADGPRRVREPGPAGEVRRWCITGPSRTRRDTAGPGSRTGSAPPDIEARQAVPHRLSSARQVSHQTPKGPASAPARPEGPVGAPARPEDPVGSPTRPGDLVGGRAGFEDPAGPPARPEGPASAPARPGGPVGAPARPEGPAGARAGPEDPVGPPARRAAPAGDATRCPGRAGIAARYATRRAWPPGARAGRALPAGPQNRWVMPARPESRVGGACRSPGSGRAMPAALRCAGPAVGANWDSVTGFPAGGACRLVGRGVPTSRRWRARGRPGEVDGPGEPRAPRCDDAGEDSAHTPGTAIRCDTFALHHRLTRPPRAGPGSTRLQPGRTDSARLAQPGRTARFDPTRLNWPGPGQTNRVRPALRPVRSPGPARGPVRLPDPVRRFGPVARSGPAVRSGCPVRPGGSARLPGPAVRLRCLALPSGPVRLPGRPGRLSGPVAWSGPRAAGGWCLWAAGPGSGMPVVVRDVPLPAGSGFRRGAVGQDRSATTRPRP